MRNACKILVRKPKGRDHFEDMGVAGMAILKWEEGANWIQLAHYRKQWDLVSTK